MGCSNATKKDKAFSELILEDAREIGLEHVTIVMQSHNNIKVNIVFNGEFISSDKRTNKSVSMKNYY